LEPGALTLQLFFGFGGQLEPGGPGEFSLFEFVTKVAQKCEHLSEVLDKLKAVMPELGDVNIAAIGISLPRERPAAGKVYLKRGPRVVASIDLSQTGQAAWMFEEYAPKEHTISYAAEKGGEPRLTFYLVFKALTPGEAVPANAFHFWKGEPSRAANTSQRIRSQTNSTSGAAGSGR
jgi:hypothetical protein